MMRDSTAITLLVILAAIQSFVNLKQGEKITALTQRVEALEVSNDE